ncbi:MAG TPA: hypothetical protein VGK14_04135 [Novimethylophilus sp.]
MLVDEHAPDLSLADKFTFSCAPVAAPYLTYGQVLFGLAKEIFGMKLKS